MSTHELFQAVSPPAAPSAPLGAPLDPKNLHFELSQHFPMALLRGLDRVSTSAYCSTPPSIFWIVSYRYGRGSILITTNKGIRDWPEVLAGDEVLATAILDRLLHRSVVLNISGRRYRLRELERTTKAPTP